MDKILLDWKVGYMSAASEIPDQWMNAQVPGAVQLDYARTQGWEPFWKGINVRDYAWMEDVYWLYKAPLNFTLTQDQQATLVFTAIDYRYEIRINGQMLHEGEGMFHPIRCDVSRFAGMDAEVQVLIYPVPKADDSNTRSQARLSCKSAACYGWDWHPRLVTAGIWDEAYLQISSKQSVTKLDISYSLNNTLDHCRICIDAEVTQDCNVAAELLDGDTVIIQEQAATQDGKFTSVMELTNPKLWYPVGYGEQNSYRLTLHTKDNSGKIIETVSRIIGLRRSKLVMNEGSWAVPGYPKSRAAAPATLEINGVRIFAKGSNWVNASVFPGEMTKEQYRSLLQLAVDANMNIMRVWGGGFVNKECFFDLCDEMGVMVWQEFPLACNQYPDEESYLSVLEAEATDIVRRLRTHPSVVLWCGGNELFNSWSGMTDQHHALRLLDKICYTEDRFTPFIMTSPLNGMAHGTYVNYDEQTDEEFITMLRRCRNTAYTEFGAPSMASVKELLEFMSEDNLTDCSPENPVWVEHHGFKGWRPGSWVRKCEAEYYFGGFTDVEDLAEKTRFIQAMVYKSLFEEARHQWPLCSMALNWCWNEPWPTAGNNSLVSWPEKPKPAYYAVQQALRSRLTSLGIDKHLWWAGERFQADVWVMNDHAHALEAGEITVKYSFGDGEFFRWGTLHFEDIAQRSNRLCGSISFLIPVDFSGKLNIILEVSGHSEMRSDYIYLCRQKKASKVVMLNVD